MRIEAVTTNDLRVRVLIFLVMCVGLAGWFAKDGWISYPAKNLNWVTQGVMPVEPEDKWTNPRVTLARLRRIEPGMTLEEVEDLLAEPMLVEPKWYRFDGADIRATFTVSDDKKVIGLEQKEIDPRNKPKKVNYRVTGSVLEKIAERIKEGLTEEELLQRLKDPSDEQAKTLWYVGIAAYGEVQIEDGKVTGAPTVLENNERTESDIRQQRGIAVCLGVIALFVLMKFVRIMTTRVVLDEEGLRFNRRRIAWDAMTGLGADEYQEKGWLDLDHAGRLKPPYALPVRALVGLRNVFRKVFVLRSISDVVARSLVPSAFPLRLDSYHITRFDELVGAICERKQYPSPLELRRKDHDGGGAPTNTTSSDDGGEN